MSECRTPPPTANPRPPDAVVTLLTTDDFLPGAQTLLYSIKANLSAPSEGEPDPDFVVLATPSVSARARSALLTAFCDSVVDVEPIPMPPPEGKSGGHGSHVPAWDAHCGLTKLRIFGLEEYGTVLYVDADCLAVGDVRPLLRLGRDAEDGGGGGRGDDGRPRSLLGAAPDVFPPDRFNAGVLVVRPSRSVLADLLARAPRLESYDGGDTGLLNAYYPDWYRSFPPSARLPFGCNAQRFLHRCTYSRRPQYWDDAVGGGGLTIVHYSSSPKPWEAVAAEFLEDGGKADADVVGVGDGRRCDDLDQLWREWYRRSLYHAAGFHGEECPGGTNARQGSAAVRASGGRVGTDWDVHDLIVGRYKELKGTGLDAREAMAAARAEFGLNRDDDADLGKKVASLFGKGG